MDDPAYSTGKIMLHPGDKVFLYTDGLYEVERDNGEEFGEARLMEETLKRKDASLKALFNGLVDSARKFSDEGRLSDDICMVGFQFKKHLKPG